MVLSAMTLFDSNHLLMIFSAILFGWAGALIGKGFAKEKCHKIVLILLWCNFGLHFLRFLNPFYLNRGNVALFYASPNNFCAVLVLMAPFLFLYGKPLLKEYLVIMSILGGAIAFLFPSFPIDIGERIEEGWMFLECIRYCLSHDLLILSAAIILASGQHQLNYHRLPMDGVMFLGACLIIFLNKLLFWKLLNPEPWYVFFDSEFENPSYLFGIPTRLSGSPVFVFIDKAFAWPFLTYHLPNGAKAYLPILWLIPTLYLLLLPMLFLGLYLPLDGGRIKKDVAFLLKRRKKEPNREEK
ncbi:MAG: hypothetical protein J6038_01035 [Bacilli bacterium]|nr:hypothetical protein [Bacilli bacterium]